MATRSTFLLLLSIFLLSTTLALSHHGEDGRERELEQCRQQCEQQHQHDRGMLRQCQQRCEERERESERERGSGSEREDPEERLEQCRQTCSERRHGQRQVQQCQHRCEERYQEEKQREGQGRDESRKRDPEQRLEECRQRCGTGTRAEEQQQCLRQCEERYREEKEREQQEGRGRDDVDEKKRSEDNPYVFGPESFIHRVRSQHGSIRLLKNFLRRSKLLLGIANYRLVIFEANPRTFAVPKQSDADQVFFVIKGEATVTLIRNEEDSHNIRRESHNLREGDILRVRAGTVVYLINRSNNQKLQIAKLIQPVSTPGRFEDFFIGGGENPESVYRTFSTSILEAALNTQQEKLERIFGRQRQGVIVEASEEQIRALSRHSSEGGPWPFGGQSSRKPFNLLQKRPDHSNEHGKLYIADSNDYRELKDLDLHVAFANITRGSMMVPAYESKATKIVIVVDGRGEFEMVCPHLASGSQSEREQSKEGSEQEEEEQSEEHQGKRYKKVRSRVTKGTVFVVPAGHPMAVIASRDENLQVVCFEVHAKNSRKILLAGKNNVVNEMEREAKELAFGVPSRLVDDVFGGAREELFVRGPQESRERREEEEEGGRSPLESILEFAGF